MNAGRTLKEGESGPGLGAENNSNTLMHRRQSLEKPGKFFHSKTQQYFVIVQEKKRSIMIG